MKGPKRSRVRVLRVQYIGSKPRPPGASGKWTPNVGPHATNGCLKGTPPAPFTDLLLGYLPGSGMNDESYSLGFLSITYYMIYLKSLLEFCRLLYGLLILSKPTTNIVFGFALVA